MATRKLTPKQKRFCEEYVIDLNGTQAAIRAGYSKKSAQQTASANMLKPVVQAYIQSLADKRSERTQINADNVLTEIAKLAFSDIRKMFVNTGHIIPIHDIDDETAAAIQSCEVVVRPSGEYDDEGKPEVEHVHKFKMADKGQNLERLGRHLKLFTDRLELDGLPKVTIRSYTTKKS